MFSQFEREGVVLEMPIQSLMTRELLEPIRSDSGFVNRFRQFIEMFRLNNNKNANRKQWNTIKTYMCRVLGY